MFSVYRTGGGGGGYGGPQEEHEQSKMRYIFFDHFIKFIIMLQIDTMISVVYCCLSGHNVDDRLSRARTFVL